MNHALTITFLALLCSLRQKYFFKFVAVYRMQRYHIREYLLLEASTKMMRRRISKNAISWCDILGMNLKIIYYSLFLDQLAWSSKNNHGQVLHLQKSGYLG